MKSVALAAAVACLLTACSSGNTSKPLIVDSANGTHLLVSSVSGEGMDASLSGTLEAGPGNCLYLTNGNNHDLIIWPAGTQFSTDESAVKIPGAAPLTIGTQIAVGGGSTTANNESYPSIPASCLTDTVVIVN
ncbi:hypothetical protein [Timonella sp. A28]|uniref:hypothetical protein n=1 Tax=Timonella sp. A28 TaxID=3442640 RepID=UPI003EBAC566